MPKAIFTRQTYKGFYSTSEETFLTEKDRLPDGTFDPAYGEVVELKEDNYYFKLGEHQAVAHRLHRGQSRISSRRKTAATKSSAS